MDEEDVIIDDQINTDTSVDGAGDKEPAGDEAKPDAGGQKVESQKAAAPEKYDLRLPENALLAPSRVDEIALYAKERGLSNEAAQEILNRENEAVDTYQKGQREFLDETRKKWVEEAHSDKEIAGIEGNDFDTNCKLAVETIATFDPEGKIMDMMKRSGIGDYPEMIKLFVRIGKAMKDAKLVHSKTQSKSGKMSDADVFYSGAST